MRHKLASFAIITAAAILLSCSDSTDPGPPVLLVVTVTSGEHVDFNGYRVLIDGAFLAFIGAHDSVTFEELSGDHEVELAELAVNCDVTGENPRDATLEGGTTRIQFDVNCESLITDPLAFGRMGASAPDVWTWDPSDDQPTQLTTHAESDNKAAWSPDGTKIAFASMRDGDLEIYVINADGTGLTNLTNAPTASDDSPTWSPDGTQIAFASVRGGVAREIYVMDSDGGNQVRLTNNPGSLDDRPSWSPDGATIAFETLRDGDLEIYLIDADGTDPRNVSNNPGWPDSDPDWSPDGTKLVFVSERDGNAEIYVMDADGSSQTNVTNSPTTSDVEPSFSPSGTRVAYGTNLVGGFEVFVIAIDGSGINNLTRSAAADGNPAWRR
jgi:TolB protein